MSRRAPRRRRTFRKSAGVVALRKINKLTRNVEKKALDQTVNVSPNIAGSVTHISAIIQGDGIGNREGNSLQAKYLGLRMSMINGSADSFIRYMVVRDNQTVGDGVPAVSDILTTSSVRSYLELITLGRFTVLLDKHVTMVASTENARLLRYHNIPLNFNIRFNGVNGTD